MSVMNKIPFAIKDSDARTTVSLETFMQFATLKNLAEDLGEDALNNFPPIPAQFDALGNIVQYDTETLEKFIRFFEISIDETKTEEFLFQAIDEENTEFEEIKKFMILINYLDNNKFLHSLAKYTANLIRDAKALFQ